MTQKDNKIGAEKLVTAMKKIGELRVRANIKVVGVTTSAQKHMNRLIAKEEGK